MKPTLPFLAFLLCLPSLAQADDRAAKAATKLLDAGVVRFDVGDVAGAREMFAKAHAMNPDLPEANRLLGLADAKLGSCEEAVAVLDGYLSVAPAADPNRAEAQAARDKCHESLLPPTGSLAVTTQPPGAQVSVDSAAPAGNTPLTVDNIAPGGHTVHLSLAGYTEVQQSVDIAAKMTSHLDLTLHQLAPAPVAEASWSRRHWWVWAIVGVVLVGAAVGITVGVLSSSGTNESTLPMLAVTR